MTLPNFLGIGASKCGTTWLHELLSQHPDVYMPTRRKEIDYFNFDENFEQGIEWYESFFPDSESAKQYKTIGEFTPRYLDNSGKCAQRIASMPSVEKLILMVRNPIDRAYSQYCHSVKAGHARNSFEDFLEDTPLIIHDGFYAKKLEHYLERYSKDRICCLVFEESVSDIEYTKQKVSSFLEVSPAKFPAASGTDKANASYIPKFQRLNYLAAKVYRNLRKKNLDWAINLGEQAGLRQLLKAGGQKVPPLAAETREKLKDTFTEDVARLEQMLDLNLDLWQIK
ncbi:MAG: sulfotransferase domain-containing protein [Cyanobacteria bacterium J06600_6]